MVVLKYKKKIIKVLDIEHNSLDSLDEREKHYCRKNNSYAHPFVCFLIMLCTFIKILIEILRDRKPCYSDITYRWKK